jgi:hypothetical protein
LRATRSIPLQRSSPRNETRRPVWLRYETLVPFEVPCSDPFVPGPQARTSVAVSNANGTVPTERRLRLRAWIIHNVRGLRLRRHPWPGQLQLHAKRASNERQRDTDQTSTRPQRNVNVTSTERQPNVNKASTEQQRVNQTIDCRRESHLQRLDEARGAIRNRWLRRVSVRPSHRVVLTPFCCTFA